MYKFLISEVIFKDYLGRINETNYTVSMYSEMYQGTVLYR